MDSRTCTPTSGRSTPGSMEASSQGAVEASNRQQGSRERSWQRGGHDGQARVTQQERSGSAPRAQQQMHQASGLTGSIADASSAPSSISNWYDHGHRYGYVGSSESAYSTTEYENGAGVIAGSGAAQGSLEGTAAQGSMEGTAQQAAQQLAVGQQQVALCRVVDSGSSLSPRATALFAHGPTGTPTGTMSLRTGPWGQLTRYSNLLLLAACIVIQEYAMDPYIHMQHDPGACQRTWNPCSRWRGKKVSSTGAAIRTDDRMITHTACWFTHVHVTETTTVRPRVKICHNCENKSESDRKTLKHWRPAKKVITSGRDRDRHWHSRNWLAICHRLAWMLESSRGKYA